MRYSMSTFPAFFNLTDLNGSNGFVTNGINSQDQSGVSVSGAGDINGDGIADIIIGANLANSNTGASYVIFGSKNGFTTPFNLTNLNGNNGFAINGIINNGASGASVSEAGDVNGDGIADIIIGAPDSGGGAGQSYVIFGSKSGFTTPFNLTDLNGNNGFVINGINRYDYSGASVSGAGDVNSDGIADIIIGAWGANSGAGKSYVIFGSKSGFTTPFNLNDLNGTNGFVINGINSQDQSGTSVSEAGDVNSDGIADIIIGAPNAGNIGAGQSYVIFGNKGGFTTPFNLADLNGTNGFIINGINSNDWSGHSVSGTGDVNDDCIADIIIGAFKTASRAGQSYIMFGSKSGFTTPFNLTDLSGDNGLVINGINSNDWSGYSVSGAGDVNGDGIADIIIGAPGANMLAGQSYVIFGNKGGFITPLNLTDLNGNNGFAINGINSGDDSGFSISRAGDVNGDGIADIIIGAPHANNNAGQSYVIFGSGSGVPTPVNLTDLSGTNASDSDESGLGL